MNNTLSLNRFILYQPIFMLLLILLNCGAAISQNNSIKTPIKITRINAPVTLDGISNEAAWQDVNSFHLLMRRPDFGSEPSEKTEVMICYDDKYLYMAGRFYHSQPEKIQATSLERDVLGWKADLFSIGIDAFNDNENLSFFYITPAGTRTDVNVFNDGEGAPAKNANVSWNTFWDVATITNQEGWFAEMRIPFSSLRYEVKDGQTTMGIILVRWIADKKEELTFPLVPIKFGFAGLVKPSQAQKVIFEGLEIHKPLYITPYILGGFGQNSSLNSQETAYIKNNKFEKNAGLDLKYGITSNLTLDLTINTDFAQVEADNQQINLTRYSLFFPEKRLFFQERQGNFDFSYEDNDRLFHSRRIGIHNGEQVKIYGGARIVGRAGKWDVGFLNMQTQSIDELPSENFGVLRLKREVINDESHIGGMLTTRIGSANLWNTTYGLDGLFHLFKDDYLTVKWAQTFENDIDNPLFSLNPSKIYIKLVRRSLKGFGYTLSYSRSGNNFNPGIGYERHQNYTRLGDRIHYGWFPENSAKLISHTVFIAGKTFIINENGTIESSQINPGWSFDARNKSSGQIGIVQAIENVENDFNISADTHVPGGKYTFYFLHCQYSSPMGERYTINSTFDVGEFYDGSQFVLSLNPGAAFSKYIQLSGLYQINKINFPDRNQKFTGHIGRLFLSAFLNSKLSFRANVQYNSAADKIITNFRFRYNPREGNDFYIVYDEGLNTNRRRENPALPSSAGRTLLLKYTYTFRL